MIATTNEQIPRPTVVLVHGLLAHPLTMWPLGRRLERAGFAVESFGYASWGHSIDAIAGRLARDVLRRTGPVHVVTHSMGAIVLRTAAANHALPLGRVVLLAPPNHGSPVATRLGSPLRRFLPALDQLADRPDSFVNSLPSEPPFEFGVIAAAGDHVVPEPSTHLPGERDHRVLPGRHGLLPFRGETAAEVVHFFRHGTFHRQAVSP